MAFKKKCFYELFGVMLVLSASLSTASGVDCNGKSFHCVNSTHFMICVDLGGGVSQSIDDFLIPCPPPTICQGTNHFECEFPAPTTPLPTLNVISETTQPWEDVVVTTNSPQRKATKEYSEKYINTESLSFGDSFTTDATVYSTEAPLSSASIDLNNRINVTDTLSTLPESNVYETTTTVDNLSESISMTTNNLDPVPQIIPGNFTTDVLTEISAVDITTIAPPSPVPQTISENITTEAATEVPLVDIPTEAPPNSVPQTISENITTEVATEIPLVDIPTEAPPNSVPQIISENITTEVTTEIPLVDIPTEAPPNSVPQTISENITTEVTTEIPLVDIPTEAPPNSVPQTISENITTEVATEIPLVDIPKVVSPSPVPQTMSENVTTEVTTKIPLVDIITVEPSSPLPQTISENITTEVTTEIPLVDIITVEPPSPVPQTISENITTEVATEIPLVDIPTKAPPNSVPQTISENITTEVTTEIPLVDIPTEAPPNSVPQTISENITTEVATEIPLVDIPKVVPPSPVPQTMSENVTTEVTTKIPLVDIITVEPSSPLPQTIPENIITEVTTEIPLVDISVVAQSNSVTQTISEHITTEVTTEIPLLDITVEPPSLVPQTIPENITTEVTTEIPRVDIITVVPLSPVPQTISENITMEVAAEMPLVDISVIAQSNSVTQTISENITTEVTTEIPLVDIITVVPPSPVPQTISENMTMEVAAEMPLVDISTVVLPSLVPQTVSENITTEVATEIPLVDVITEAPMLKDVTMKMTPSTNSANDSSLDMNLNLTSVPENTVSNLNVNSNDDNKQVFPESNINTETFIDSEKNVTIPSEKTYSTEVNSLANNQFGFTEEFVSNGLIVEQTTESYLAFENTNPPTTTGPEILTTNAIQTTKSAENSNDQTPKGEKPTTENGFHKDNTETKPTKTHDIPVGKQNDTHKETIQNMNNQEERKSTAENGIPNMADLPTSENNNIAFSQNKTQKNINQTVTNQEEKNSPAKTGFPINETETKLPKSSIVEISTGENNVLANTIFDTVIVPVVESTELPTSTASDGNFQTVANEITTEATVSVLGTEKSVFIDDNNVVTKSLNVTTEKDSKNTTTQFSQDQETSVIGNSYLETKQPNTNTFDNAVTTENAIFLPIHTSIITTSEGFEHGIQSLHTSTEQPITVTFNEQLQTVVHNNLATEQPIISKINEQVAQSNNENSINKEKPILVNNNNYASGDSNSLKAINNTQDEIAQIPRDQVSSITENEYITHGIVTAEPEIMVLTTESEIFKNGLQNDQSTIVNGITTEGKPSNDNSKAVTIEEVIVSTDATVNINQDKSIPPYDSATTVVTSVNVPEEESIIQPGLNKEVVSEKINSDSTTTESNNLGTLNQGIPDAQMKGSNVRETPLTNANEIEIKLEMPSRTTPADHPILTIDKGEVQDVIGTTENLNAINESGLKQTETVQIDGNNGLNTQDTKYSSSISNVPVTDTISQTNEDNDVKINKPVKNTPRDAVDTNLSEGSSSGTTLNIEKAVLSGNKGLELINNNTIDLQSQTTSQSINNETHNVNKHIEESIPSKQIFSGSQANTTPVHQIHQVNFTQTFIDSILGSDTLRDGKSTTERNQGRIGSSGLDTVENNITNQQNQATSQSIDNVMPILIKNVQESSSSQGNADIDQFNHNLGQTNVAGVLVANILQHDKTTTESNQGLIGSSGLDTIENNIINKISQTTTQSIDMGTSSKLNSIEGNTDVQQIKSDSKVNTIASISNNDQTALSDHSAISHQSQIIPENSDRGSSNVLLAIERNSDATQIVSDSNVPTSIGVNTNHITSDPETKIIMNKVNQDSEVYVASISVKDDKTITTETNKGQISESQIASEANVKGTSNVLIRGTDSKDILAASQVDTNKLKQETEVTKAASASVTYDKTTSETYDQTGQSVSSGFDVPKTNNEQSQITSEGSIEKGTSNILENIQGDSDKNQIVTDSQVNAITNKLNQDSELTSVASTSVTNDKTTTEINNQSGQSVTSGLDIPKNNLINEQIISGSIDVGTSNVVKHIEGGIDANHFVSGTQGSLPKNIEITTSTNQLTFDSVTNTITSKFDQDSELTNVESISVNDDKTIKTETNKGQTSQSVTSGLGVPKNNVINEVRELTPGSIDKITSKVPISTEGSTASNRIVSNSQANKITNNFNQDSEVTNVANSLVTSDKKFESENKNDQSSSSVNSGLTIPQNNILSQQSQATSEANDIGSSNVLISVEGKHSNSRVINNQFIQSITTETTKTVNNPVDSQDARSLSAPETDSKTKPTVLETVRNVLQTIGNFFNTASKNSSSAIGNTDNQARDESNILSNEITPANIDVTTEQNALLDSTLQVSKVGANVPKLDVNIKSGSTELAPVNKHQIGESINIIRQVATIVPFNEASLPTNNDKDQVSHNDKITKPIISETSPGTFQSISNNKVVPVVEPVTLNILATKTTKSGNNGTIKDSEGHLLSTVNSKVNKTEIKGQSYQSVTSNPVTIISITTTIPDNLIQKADAPAVPKAEDISFVKQPGYVITTISEQTVTNGNRADIGTVLTNTNLNAKPNDNGIAQENIGHGSVAIQGTGRSVTNGMNILPSIDVTSLFTDSAGKKHLSTTGFISGLVSETAQDKTSPTYENNNAGIRNPSNVDAGNINEKVSSNFNQQNDIPALQKTHVNAVEKDIAQSPILIHETTSNGTVYPRNNSSAQINNISQSATNENDASVQQNTEVNTTGPTHKPVTVSKKPVYKITSSVQSTPSASARKTVPKPVSNVTENPTKQIANNTLNFSCLNGIRGRYSDKNDCRKFYICVGTVGNTQPIVGHCPVNTVFSEIKKQCTKNMSHCIRENEFKCPSGGRFSDVIKENVYYICVNHNSHLYRFKFQCQRGFTLNKTTVRCIENKEVEANESVSISTDNISDSSSQSASSSSTSSSSGSSSGSSSSASGSSTASSSSTSGSSGNSSGSSSTASSSSNTSGDSDSSSSKSKKKKEKSSSKDGDDDDDAFECEKEGKFRVKNDCKRYYLCKKNGKGEYRRKLKKCESGEVFHKKKRKCVDEDDYEC